MEKVAARTPSKYYIIGTQLGIEPSHVEAYRLKHQGISCDIYIEIFDTWVKQPGATWLKMINILKSDIVDEKVLAQDLEISMTPVSADMPHQVPAN